MRLTLLESDRSFLRSAECASLSILAHVGVVWLAVAMTEGGGQIPIDGTRRRSTYMTTAAPRQDTGALWDAYGVMTVSHPERSEGGMTQGMPPSLRSG